MCSMPYDVVRDLMQAQLKFADSLLLSRSDGAVAMDTLLYDTLLGVLVGLCVVYR